MKSNGIATKTIATCLALTAFAIALVAGLLAGNPAVYVLKVALISMLVCHVVGVFVGMVSEHVVSEYVAQVRRANPIPNVQKMTAPVMGDDVDNVIEV